ncbi:hypothetical protein B0H11DRAFT_2215010 [Mycena galericulata]|nr:hypothetical protein B0H11DRAFT_2233355 [Mycena galericulata]KAJ7511173.1 hypothetical protein B0H11DRAFT_2215010 [Mycena galericulata]
MHSVVDKIAENSTLADDEVEAPDHEEDLPDLIPVEDLDRAVVLYQQPKILISRDTRALNQLFNLYIPMLWMSFNVLFNFVALDGSFRVNKTRHSNRWVVGRTDGERVEQAWAEMIPDPPRRRRNQVRAKL